MGKGIVVIILVLFLSARSRLESKLIVAACRDASMIRGSIGTMANHKLSIDTTQDPC
jgi:hypothetical protein